MRVKKQSVLVLGLLTVAVAIGASSKLRGTPPPATTRAASPQGAFAPLARELSRVRTALVARTGEPLGASAPATGDVDPELVAQARTTFASMRRVAGYLHTTSVRRELADTLLASPGAAALAAQTVEDPAFARRVFGDEQAESRYFSVALLRHAAERGDPVPLRTATRTVALAMQASEAPDEGGLEDLRNLVEAVASLDGAESMTAEAWRELGFPAQGEAMQDVYIQSMLHALARKKGYREARLLVEAITSRIRA